jgi:hypothetical protein
MSARSIHTHMSLELAKPEPRAHRVVALMTIVAAVLFAIGLSTTRTADASGLKTGETVGSVADVCHRGGAAKTGLEVGQTSSCETPTRW